MFDTSKANCIGIDTELFFTDHHYDPADLYFLKKVCNSCEIKQKCRDYALKHDVDGLWAGTTKHERKQERKRLGITPITLIKEINQINEKSA